MKQRIAIWRIIWSIVAVVLLVGAIQQRNKQQGWLLRLKELQEMALLAETVDFSKPGSFSGRWKQGSSFAHGEGIYLAVAGDKAPGKTETELLEGLDGTVRVSSSEGKEVFSGPIVHGWSNSIRKEKPIMLAYLGFPLEKGVYALDITVTNGAEALSGMEQTISVEYLLCGLEGWPAAIAGLLAFLFGLSGAIILIWVIIGFVRYGMRTACSCADAADGEGEKGSQER